MNRDGFRVRSDAGVVVFDDDRNREVVLSGVVAGGRAVVEDGGDGVLEGPAARRVGIGE